MDDISFGTYTKTSTKEKFYFTSLAKLTREQGGQSVTAYGWSKTPTTITFIYRKTRDLTNFVTFPRPRFVTNVETRKVGSAQTEKKYRVRTYDWNSNHFINGLALRLYYPTCIYFARKYI